MQKRRIYVAIGLLFLCALCVLAFVYANITNQANLFQEWVAPALFFGTTIPAGILIMWDTLKKPSYYYNPDV